MLTFNSSCYTVKLLHCAHLRCSCCRTWSPTEDRETQKVVSEQEHGWWQAACMWGGFANEKPLCPQWRLTLWFREAGSVSCLPCTFPIRSLCQASAEQSSPCDWEAGRETEGESKTEKGRTKGRGGTRGPNLQGNIRLLRYASVPFLSASPRVLIRIARRMMIMPSIHSVPSSPKQPPFMVTQTYFPSQLELKSGKL